jgi:hypothetical protein
LRAFPIFSQLFFRLSRFLQGTGQAALVARPDRKKLPAGIPFGREAQGRIVFSRGGASFFLVKAIRFCDSAADMLPPNEGQAKK